MKHDFRTRELSKLKIVPEGPCDCVECQKSRVFEQQYNNRMKTYGGTTPINMNIKDHYTHRMGRSFDLDFADGPIIGDYTYSTVDQPIYRKAGDAPIKTRKAGTNLGKFKRFNTSKNWLILDDIVYGEIWVSFTHPDEFHFKAPDPSKAVLTDEQKMDIALNVASSASPLANAAISGGKVVADTIGDIWGTFKWVLIALAIIIVLLLVYKIKNS